MKLLKRGKIFSKEAILLAMTGVNWTGSTLLHHPTFACEVPIGQQVDSSFTWWRRTGDRGQYLELVARGLVPRGQGYVPEFDPNGSTYNLRLLQSSNELSDREDHQANFICDLPNDAGHAHRKNYYFSVLRSQNFKEIESKEMMMTVGDDDEGGGDGLIDIRYNTRTRQLRFEKPEVFDDDEKNMEVKVWIREQSKWLDYVPRLDVKNGSFVYLIDNPIVVMGVKLLLCYRTKITQALSCGPSLSPWIIYGSFDEPLDNSDDADYDDDFIFFMGTSILILCLIICVMSMTVMIRYRRRRISNYQRQRHDHDHTSSIRRYGDVEVECPPQDNDIEMMVVAGHSATNTNINVHVSNESKNVCGGLDIVWRGGGGGGYDKWVLRNEKEKIEDEVALEKYQKLENFTEKEEETSSDDEDVEEDTTMQIDLEALELQESEELERAVNVEFADEIGRSSNQLDVILEGDESQKSSFEDGNLTQVPRHRWASTWTNLFDMHRRSDHTTTKEDQSGDERCGSISPTETLI